MSKQNGLFRRRGIFAFLHKGEFGRWREKSTGTSDRKEALAFKQRFEEDLANDHLPTDTADWSVEQACTRWVGHHVLGSAKAKANERSLLNQLVRSRMAGKKLRNVTLDDLKSYQSERSKSAWTSSNQPRAAHPHKRSEGIEPVASISRGELPQTDGAGK